MGLWPRWLLSDQILRMDFQRLQGPLGSPPHYRRTRKVQRLPETGNSAEATRQQIGELFHRRGSPVETAMAIPADSCIAANESEATELDCGNDYAVVLGRRGEPGFLHALGKTAATWDAGVLASGDFKASLRVTGPKRAELTVQITRLLC